MKLYIITREINEYEQDGEYFVAAFTQNPLPDQLTKLKIDHFERSEQLENEWFHLRVVEEGEPL